MIAVVFAAVVVVVAVGLSMGDRAESVATPLTPPAATDVRLPVLSSAEAALVRARTLVARGRLSEAMVWLDRVALDSPERPEADRLRVELQQLLLASVRASSGSRGSRSGGSGPGEAIRR